MVSLNQRHNEHKIHVLLSDMPCFSRDLRPTLNLIINSEYCLRIKKKCFRKFMILIVLF